MIILKKHKQLDGIRKSCQLAAQALKFIEPYVVPGTTTNQLDAILAEWIKDQGATSACLGYKGFPKSICTSINEVVCHGVPNETKLKDGDIVNIDVTTILNGYYGDTSRMFLVGQVSDSAKKLCEVTYQCLQEGIAQVRPGNYLGNIGWAINEYATKHHYSVVYQFSGHGVGIKFHEPPHVPHIAPKDSDIKMREGMVFTIEPMINEGVPEAVIGEDGWTARTTDAKLSAQYEHTILVTNTGAEVLTQ